MRLNYTKKEQEEIIKSMIILEDTREQTNKHIIDFFDKKKIAHKSKKLDFGDYSFYIPRNELLSINRDIFFDKDIVVERKNSLSEIAGNIGEQRTRFESELIRKKDAKMYLIIEDDNWSNLINGLYTADYRPNAFIGTLSAFEARYDIRIEFITKSLMGWRIHQIFKYYLREKLLNMGVEIMDGLD